MISEALQNARRRLLAGWLDSGANKGWLSSSALSTATATMAFSLSRHRDRDRHVASGRRWICRHQNDDGGWGDTTGSPSNISTTTLCWASLGPAAAAQRQRAEDWLVRQCGSIAPATLAAAIRRRYGRDQTFSVPILLTCTLAGRLGDDNASWRWVPALPFELAACPQRWFRWLGLPMVSYALPALIAIGQARHHHRPSSNPLARVARRSAQARTLRILQQIQPRSGGYLEAAPLTSFVAMSLLSMGLHQHPVVERALGFLHDTVREDGSWPIDTNLDTWLTTLSTEALSGELGPAHAKQVGDWLLGQQYAGVHPYTNAPPGGWAWTDLSGGVPDADDTAGALLALHSLRETERYRGAAERGVGWLLGVQNRDGGFPTFCRGWGKLPFDRSSPDITAHVVRAFAAWREDLSARAGGRVDRARARALDYLVRSQRDDGAWVPLWFGNQREQREENPLYGTSRVVRALAVVRPAAVPRDAAGRAVRWLLAAQAGDGGFGAAPGVPASIEETGVAVEALAEWALAGRAAGDDVLRAVQRGAAWLVAATEGGRRFDAAPIGLYFAKLWYSEDLYPVIMTVSALARAQRCAMATHSVAAG